MDAYLRPSVSYCLITTIIRQRKKNIGELKITKNTVKRILGLCITLFVFVCMCGCLCRLCLHILSTNTLGKCMNPIILPPAMGK